MGEIDLKCLKQAVDSFGRQRVAEQLKMPYGTLSSKLGGFNPIYDDELHRINTILGKPSGFQDSETGVSEVVS